MPLSQFVDVGHASQSLPPQSTSVSPPSLMPLRQHDKQVLPVSALNEVAHACDGGGVIGGEDVQHGVRRA
jgi:hypothetical protein